MKSKPILLAHETRTGDGTLIWRAWCPFCCIYHTHGAGPGHRVAHCDSDGESPFRNGGYELRLEKK